jgi:DNA polymerase elongation subunit (family B)
MRSKLSEQRCIHRHTIKEHPSCFGCGRVKQDKVEKIKVPSIIPVRWTTKADYKVGILDIETDSLKADFGMMLTWCIKEKGGDITYDTITRAEILSFEFDKRITQTLVDEIKKYNVIIGYYSTKFDIPFIRTRAMKYGIDFPEFQEVWHWDLYYAVKAKMKLSRNSLEAATRFLGVEGKTHLDPAIWLRGKYGDEAAIAEILSHNKFDVDITEQLYDRLFPYSAWNKRSL